MEVFSTWTFALYHKYWDKKQEGISVNIARCLFQYKIIFQYKDEKILVSLLLNRKFERNLNELPKPFQLSRTGSTSIYEKNYLLIQGHWRAIIFFAYQHFLMLQLY